MNNYFTEKYTIADLKEFIDKNCRRTSPKTGKDIKYNLFHLSKNDLEAIILNNGYWNDFTLWLEYGKIDSNEIKYKNVELE